MTVGIGAGNPGGGTFHAVVFTKDDSHAFALVDTLFEQVPQGGPDLTAEQSRAHEDLPFIWWVVDHVTELDRRAVWMRHWLVGTTSVQTGGIFERGEPILLVSHDHDGMWRLSGTTDANTQNGRISHLHHAVDADSSLIDVLDLQPGHRATRSEADSPWTRQLSDPN